jgi:DNA polymerase-4
MTKKIIHIDLDAFYASVEQRDNPTLKNRPVIVGGDPNSRGVVATCSYEARKFGIHSAMSSHKAYQLCPQAIFIKPQISKYKSVSTEIKKIFYEYTDLVEPLSLDEAFLDVTRNKKNNHSATLIAQEIKNKIYEKTQLTSSAGVSYNKFLAKIASDYKKPKGLTLIKPEEAIPFIKILPIRKFFGIGKVTEKKMIQIGIKTGGDLSNFSLNELINLFGKMGKFYYDIVRGKDLRPVNPNRSRKSIGKETTLSKDISDPNEILEILINLAEKVEYLLISNNKKGKTITLKIKFNDFITRSSSLAKPVQKKAIIIKEIQILINKINLKEKKVRLLGITVSNFNEQKLLPEGQLALPFKD